MQRNLAPYRANPETVLPTDDSTAYRIPITEYGTDAEQILQLLESLKQEFIRSPYIREFTVSLLTGLPNNDTPQHVNRILQFVRQYLVYVKDPLDSEYVISPERLLTQWQQKHYMAGDCDDHVLLLNTMLGTVGVPTKFVGVKFGQTDVFNHVISGIVLDNKMYFVDPCSKFNPQPVYKEKLIL